MGVSTDGILFYGILLDEDIDYKFQNYYDEDTSEDIEVDWEEYYAKQVGVIPPKEEYDDTNPGDYQKFWKESREAVAESHCEIGVHCSFDYPMYYVAVKEFRNSRGFSTEISDLSVTYNLVEKLKSFCKIMEIEYQDPKWYLVSVWG